MKVPLIAKVVDNGMSIVTNGKKKVISFPFRPYVWAREICAMQHQDKEGPYEFTDLWKKEPVKLFKLFFNNPDLAYKYYRNEEDSHNVFTEFYSQQVMIEQEDFFLDYPNNRKLNILVFDIEVFTDGSGIFPNCNDHPIIAIGCWFNGEVKIFANYTDIDQDENIVSDFLDYVKEIDPDVVCGYNHIAFDIPYIVGRAQKLEINDINGKPKICNLTRYGTLPFIQRKKDEKPQIELHGRIMFDIFNPVMKDQSLFGIKDHKMSSVAAWYDIDYVDLDVTNTSAYLKDAKEKKKLIKYLENDVIVTKKLMDIYFPLQVDLAEMMKVPLDTIINGAPSFIPKLVIARDLFKNKLLPLQANKYRYKSFRFQAAIVDIQKKGFFKEVHKVDFASLYPNIIRTFNIGADTTQICSFLPFTGEYKMKKTGDFIWLNVPDENFQKNILIKIDVSKEGYLKKSMDELFVMRNEAKDKIKEGGDDIGFYNTRSSAIKVIMNSIFGYQGNKYATWGDMGSAIAIVAIARWMILHLHRELTGTVVETDTDGLYVDEEVDVQKLNAGLGNYIHDHTDIPLDEITIELEHEFSGPAYFYKQKNYALLKEGGKIEKHGVAMKSTRVAKLYDKVIDKMCDGILNERGDKHINDVIRASRDLTIYSMSDFEMKTRIKLDKYKNENALQPKLARMAKEHLNRDIKVGDSVSYVRTWDGYKLTAIVKNFSELDKKYYGERIEKGLYVFDKGILYEKEQRKIARAKAKQDMEERQGLLFEEE